jgi:hypothetical protein
MWITWMALAGCNGPTWGTWMFTKDVTAATGTECLDDVIHNFVGAYEPITVGDDPTWTESDTGEISPEVFFARVERTAEGAVLIVGEEALPGEVQNDGSWLFYWTNVSSGRETLGHVTGYSYDHTFETATTLRIQGDLTGGTFTGTWEEEDSAIDAWTESDTWGEEAAVQVGATGSIPSSTYLLRIDTATGAEESAANTQAEYDCGAAGCTLTVSSSCAYRYTLTGQSTGFTGDDSRWVEDAGQSAGN